MCLIAARSLRKNYAAIFFPRYTFCVSTVGVVMKKLIGLCVVFSATLIAAHASGATRDGCSRSHNQCLESANNFEDSCNRRCAGNFDCESRCSDRADGRIESCRSSLSICNRTADEEQQTWDDINRKANPGTIKRFGTDPSQDGWRQWNDLMRQR